MTRKEKIAAFNPNDPGSDAQLYGLPFTTAETAVVAIPVPWDSTTSYHSGTSHGPQAIANSSTQVDLFDSFLPDAWHYGIGMAPMKTDWLRENVRMREQTAHYLARYEDGERPAQEPDLQRILVVANETHDRLKADVRETALAHLANNKLVCVIGGEHSIPLGLLEAVAQHHPQFGILQIDAHLDLRNEYEGFAQSHASIMHNALKLKEVTKMVNVAARDYCEEEAVFAAENADRVVLFTDAMLAEKQFSGNQSWSHIVEQILAELPEKVYISFDIDGLDPGLCPNTGTPVPGGLSFNQAIYLVQQVALSGRTIIGFDLCEVSPGDDSLPATLGAWDGNVGARLLYRLANAAIRSQPKSWREQFTAVLSHTTA